MSVWPHNVQSSELGAIAVSGGLVRRVFYSLLVMGPPLRGRQRLIRC